VLSVCSAVFDYASASNVGFSAGYSPR